MEDIIQKIHSVKLKNWAIICLLLIVVTTLIAVFGNSVNSFILAQVCPTIGNLILVSSLAVYAIKEKSTTKIVLILACIACCINLFGIYKAYDNPIIDWSHLDWNHMRPDEYNEMIAYLYNKMAVFGILSSIVLLIGFLYGLTSLKEQYKIGWIIFTCAFGLTLINTAIFAPSDIDKIYTNSHQTSSYEDESSYDNGYYYSEHPSTYRSFTSKNIDTQQIKTYGIMLAICSILQLIGLIMLFRVKEPNTITYDFTKSRNKAAAPQNISMNIKSAALINLKALYDHELITESEYNINKSRIFAGNENTIQQVTALAELKKLLDAGIISEYDVKCQKRNILSGGGTTR